MCEDGFANRITACAEGVLPTRFDSGPASVTWFTRLPTTNKGKIILAVTCFDRFKLGHRTGHKLMRKKRFFRVLRNHEKTNIRVDVAF